MPRAAARKKTPDSNDKEVGRRIRARRLMRGMSQATLADHLGLTFQQVQKYEKGTNRVGAGRLQRIAEILDVPVSYFFNEGAQAVAPASIEFLDTACAVRLMQAYRKIGDPKVQKALVELVERIAVQHPARSA